MDKVYIKGIIGGVVFALAWFTFSGFEDLESAVLGGLVFAVTFSLFRKLSGDSNDAK